MCNVENLNMYDNNCGIAFYVACMQLFNIFMQRMFFKKMQQKRLSTAGHTILQYECL